jgi:hypothetical protein
MQRLYLLATSTCNWAELDKLFMVFKLCLVNKRGCNLLPTFEIAEMNYSLIHLQYFLRNQQQSLIKYAGLIFVSQRLKSSIFMEYVAEFFGLILAS